MAHVNSETLDFGAMVLKCDGLVVAGVELTSADLTPLDGLTSTVAELNILTGVTATAAEINQHCDESANSEIVAATNVIAASESGKTFFLNSATEFVSTLPTPALGLRFTFVVAAAPSGASYTIVATGATTTIKGHVLTNDVNSATDADFGITGEHTITLVDGKAVAGDRVDLTCDGTNWFMRASCSVFDAITLS